MNLIHVVGIGWNIRIIDIRSRRMDRSYARMNGMGDDGGQVWLVVVVVMMMIRIWAGRGRITRRRRGRTSSYGSRGGGIWSGI